MNPALLENEPVIVPSMSIADQIYEALKERILLGKIVPGERIVENIIANDFKTSRTPIRAALQRLMQDGLVERILQGGLRVTVITPQMVKQVFGIRAALEVYAAELACDNVDAGALLELKSMSRSARRFLSGQDTNTADSLMTLWQINTSFHEAFCRAAGSDLLLKVINQMNNLVRRFRFLSLKKTRRRAWDEHESMIRYLESKDRAKLRELMKAHIELAASDALKTLENGQWEKEA